MKTCQHMNILIRGRVQGVGFRWSAAHQATAVGLVGFVRNQPDGTVYIEAEGTPQALADFINWCKKGPGTSHVDSVGVGEGPVLGFREFEIRKGDFS